MGVIKRMLVAFVLLAIATGVGAMVWLQTQGIAPRTLAPYLAHRAEGHNGVIVRTAGWAEALLMRVDRGAGNAPASWSANVGARPASETAGSALGEILIRSAEQLRAAVKAAQPGAILTLMPGTYRIDHGGNGTMSTGHAGTALAPITLRAAKPGTVVLESGSLVALRITEPYWRVENLGFKGVCDSDDQCEHALHIVGNAHHFEARNNTFTDFNAHVKINGVQGQFPDHGLVENNTLTNTRARDTGNPVTPVDLVAASHWTLRGNLISDFIKRGGDQVSYGAFAKGGGGKNIFERNVVICEHKLQGQRGQRIGLSLGGGGTDKLVCRDQRCVVEQEQSVIRNNLIASCSDEGMYLNSAADSQISHNTVIDTSGILVRFPASNAQVEGNLVDGAIRGRNGGEVRLDDNLADPIWTLYMGRHPQRSRFRNAGALDFGWRDAAPRRVASVDAGTDICGAKRPAAPRYGAFEDFPACAAP